MLFSFSNLLDLLFKFNIIWLLLVGILSFLSSVLERPNVFKLTVLVVVLSSKLDDCCCDAYCCKLGVKSNRLGAFDCDTVWSGGGGGGGGNGGEGKLVWLNGDGNGGENCCGGGDICSLMLFEISLGDTVNERPDAGDTDDKVVEIGFVSKWMNKSFEFDEIRLLIREDDATVCWQLVSVGVCWFVLLLLKLKQKKRNSYFVFTLFCIF